MVMFRRGNDADDDDELKGNFLILQSHVEVVVFVGNDDTLLIIMEN